MLTGRKQILDNQKLETCMILLGYLRPMYRNLNFEIKLHKLSLLNFQQFGTCYENQLNPLQRSAAT